MDVYLDALGFRIAEMGLNIISLTRDTNKINPAFKRAEGKVEDDGFGMPRDFVNRYHETNRDIWGCESGLGDSRRHYPEQHKRNRFVRSALVRNKKSFDS